MSFLRTRGKLISAIGVLLLFGALGLSLYNIYDSDRAESASEEATKLVEEYREENIDPHENDDVILVDNRPDYEKNPNMPMPEVEIDGQVYIGNLVIPSLGLDLAVISEWSYAAFKIAPCRYSGSIYLHNMVIAAHNYRRHFGPVRSLPEGAEIQFIDMAGNTFYYEVAKIEVLDPMQSEEMKSSEYDLTLFTCVLSGQARSAIRCTMTRSVPVGQEEEVTGEDD